MRMTHSPMLAIVSLHEDRTTQLRTLAAKSGLTPVGSGDSGKLQAVLKSDLVELRAADSTALDKAFLNEEIDHHRAVIQEVTDTLLPSAENAELKNDLSEMRPHVAENLAAAEKILKTLK